MKVKEFLNQTRHRTHAKVCFIIIALIKALVDVL